MKRIFAIIGILIVSGLGGAACEYRPTYSAADIARADAKQEALNQQTRADMLKRGFVAPDTAGLSDDQKRAIEIAKKTADESPGLYYLYKVEHDEEGWSVLASPYGGRTDDGHPAMPTTGSQFYVKISADWKQVQVNGGA